MPRRITEQKIHLGKLYKVYRTVHCSVSIKPKMGLKINPFYYRQFLNVAGCLCRPNLDPVLSENKTFFHDAFKGNEQNQQHDCLYMILLGLKGPSINYVVSKSAIFDHPPLVVFFIKQVLCSKSSLGLPPLPPTETT